MQIPALIKTFSTRRAACAATLSIAAASGLSALLPQAASAGAVLPDAPRSPNAQDVYYMYIAVLAIGVITLAGVIFALWRATRSAAREPEQTPTVRRAAMVSMILAFALSAVGAVSFANNLVAAPSRSGVGSGFKTVATKDPQLKVVNDVQPPAGPSLSVTVNGQQYLWRYQYTGVPGMPYTYHTLVVPVGVTVILDVTTSDVEHAWWVPQLTGSIDALPGYISKGWFKVDKPGVYKGAGTRINGTNYASQTTTVVALPPAAFAKWIAAKKLAISDAMTALSAERASGAEQQLITGRAAGAGAAK